MIFSTKFTITNKLLFNIKEIVKVGCELNNKRFSHISYSEIFEKTKENGTKMLSLKEGELDNYISTLEKFGKKNIEFNLNTILSTHYFLTSGLYSKNQVGKFRNAGCKKTVKSLVKFVNDNYGKIDILILAGLFYKNFLTIEPFVYASRSVSIISTKVLLKELDLNILNLLNFEKLGVVNIKDNTKWLEYFTGIILEEINRVKKGLDKVNLPANVELNEDQKKILKYLEKNGVITDSLYSKITERKKATRVLDFNRLIRDNLIERRGNGRLTHYILK